MTEPHPPDLIAKAAARAAGRPFYLAGTIAAFQQLRAMDDGQLVRFLHCSSETLHKLRLCRRPDADSTAFQADVRQITERFEVDPTPLLQLLREVSAVEAMQHSQPKRSHGFLMAARDKPRRRGRDDEEPEN